MAELVVLERAASTNDCAWERGRALPSDPDGATPDARVRLAVVAREQTEGRGRAGRAWASPPDGGLYLSLYARPMLPPARAALLTVAAALAAREACAAHGCAPAPALKWPNDLLAPDGSGRKLAGILTETRSERGTVHEAVIGIGLNLAPPVGGWPGDLGGRVVTLAELAPLAAPPPPAELARAIVAAFDRAAGALARPEGGAELIARARAASAMWGRRVRVERAHGVAHGIAKDWADDGGLVVRLDEGPDIVVHAGDVHVAWEPA